MIGTLAIVIGFDVLIIVIFELEFIGSSLIHLGPIDAALAEDWSLIQLFIEGISGDFVRRFGN